MIAKGNENSAWFSLSSHNHAGVTSWGAAGEPHSNQEEKNQKERWEIMWEESAFKWPPKVSACLNYRKVGGFY